MKKYLFALALTLLVTACAGAPRIESEARYPTGYDRTTTGEDIYGERESIFGEGGLPIFGKRGDKAEETGIGVNSYLWRAALDTVSFMPLASADPFGGVILTDWYSTPDKQNERYKLNVLILDRQLRSSGVQVKMFRQVLRGGTWRDAETSPASARELEDAILTRARQMRVGSLHSD